MRVGMEKKISLRLDVELVDGLQAFADRERVPLSYVLRHLVLRFLRPDPSAALRGWAPLGEVSTQEKAGRQSRFAAEGAEARRSAASDRAKREQALFDEKVFALFDGFRQQGLDMKEATKRTNYALKEKNHPWATYEVVADVLRKSGRFRKPKGRPQG
jgi:hypothetical protein